MENILDLIDESNHLISEGLITESLKFKPDYHFSFKFTKKQLKDRVVEDNTLEWAAKWGKKWAKSDSDIPFEIVSDQIQKGFPRNSKEMNAMKKYIKQSTGLKADQIEKAWKKIPKESNIEPDQSFTKIPSGVNVKEIESARKDLTKAISLLEKTSSSLESLYELDVKHTVSNSVQMLKLALRELDFKLDYEWKEEE